MLTYIKNYLQSSVISVRLNRVRLTGVVARLRNMSVVVNVKQGKLEGSLCESVLGTSYFSFKGIPFAAPPLGPLRFKVFNERNENIFLSMQSTIPT